MKCEQFERRLNQAFDQRSALVEQIDLVQHAETCDVCQGMLAAAMIVEEACQAASLASEAPALPDDFSERVVQQYAAAPVELAHRAHKQPFVSPMLVASLAGMLLLALLPLVAWIAQPTAAPVGQVAQIDSSGASPRPTPAIPAQQVSTEKRTGSFLGPPPFGTGGNVALALTIMPLPERIGLDRLEATAIPGVDRIADSIQRVVHIIRWTLPPFPFQAF